MTYPGALAVFRRYVCDFVNRQDFTVLPQIMSEDYALLTAGHEIRGRDGAYRAAVARQLEQFPGLVYTIHELHVAPGSIAVRFSEHGASKKYCGSTAVWGSIAIYRAQGDRLISCSIEQDFYSRRRQLKHNAPLPVPAPAIAPWDSPERPADAASEQVVRRWGQRSGWLTTLGIDIDDGAGDEATEDLRQDSIELLDIASSGEHVTFRALQRGRVADESQAQLYLAGMVKVSQGSVVSGHVVRDRLGLHRRLRR